MPSIADKLGVWASTHLSASQEGMLYTLYPHLTPARHAAAFREARPSAPAPEGSIPFAATLETFALVSARLDEYANGLQEGERQTFRMALLGEQDAESLLKYLLATS